MMLVYAMQLGVARWLGQLTAVQLFRVLEHCSLGMQLGVAVLWCFALGFLL